MKNKSKKRLFELALIIIGLAFIVIVILLFIPKKTKTISKTEPDEIVLLTCRLKGTSEQYLLFSDLNYDDIDYEVKIKFVNQIISNLTTTVSKNFDNLNDAMFFIDKLQANYNIYVGQRNISQEGLVPTYTSIDNIGKMVLSISGKYLAYDNAPLLMLGNEVATKETVTDYEEFLLKKNFSCTKK